LHLSVRIVSVAGFVRHAQHVNRGLRKGKYLRRDLINVIPESGPANADI
jgi:hypothetical protein